MTTVEEKFPPVRVPAGLWRLDADPFRVQASAAAWRKAGKAGAAIGDEVVQNSRHVLSEGWVGHVRDSFARHQSRLVRSLDSVQIRAEAVARELEGIAGLLRHYQTALDDELDNLCRKVLCLNNPRLLGGGGLLAGLGELTFLPKSRTDVASINAAVRVAEGMRRELKAALRIHAAKLARAREQWRALAATWKPIAQGLEARTFRLPDEVAGTMVLVVDGRAVVNTGPGDDSVLVSTDPATGQVVIEVNGVKHYQPRGTEVTIRGGEGNDSIAVSPGTLVKVTMLGGAGQDRIRGGDDDDTILGGLGRDRIRAGGGADYVSGGAANDYLDGQGGRDRIGAGAGNDTAYGLDGSDYLSGGTGRDYLEGGRGYDVIDGGVGADLISGGTEDDRLRGGLGDDVFYAGKGVDTVTGGGGADLSYQESKDHAAGDVPDVVHVEVADVAGFIKIDGSPEFRERVLDDLHLLESSPAGQKMLRELKDRSGFWNELTIRELSAQDNGYAHKGEKEHWYGTERDSAVDYNPDYISDSNSGRPITVLYHEFGHIYSFWNGIFESDYIAGGPDLLVVKGERQAAGLPFDHDNDPSTPDIVDPRQPLDYTENGLRKEMRHPNRDTYNNSGWTPW